MKCKDKELREGFEMKKELEHFAVVESQYSWGWRLPIDGLQEKYKRYLK